MKAGCVYLVGGGSGAADLITLRGLRLLRECDALLYDDLLDDALLRETKPDCERIFVGKRYGSHAARQEEIHALLRQKASEGKTVVRLKGGDPFVFGRGGEEALFLRQEGIAYAVVPGVSAAIAVPAAVGIPVTHRGLARSFHVITGHTAGGTLPDLPALAKLEGTLVFLMGLHHLEEIASGLCEGGKNPQTPAAVISQGGTPRQRVVRAALGELAAAVRGANLIAPAVIVVGKVAGLDVSDTMQYPLGGVRIGVTGTKRLCARLGERLRALGAAVTELDYLQIVPHVNDAMLTCALRHWRDYAWCVFTSPNGVELFFEYLRERSWDLRRLAGVKFAAVGAGTAAALERRGIYADYLPQSYDVASLVQGLCERVSRGEKLLILRAKDGSPVLTEVLDAAGIRYADVSLYSVTVDTEKRREARDAAKEMDFMTFASGSGVRGLLENGGELPQGVRTVCIGAETARVLAAYGYAAPLVAKNATLADVSAAIVEEVQRETISETAHERSHAAAGAGDKVDGGGDDLPRFRHRGGGDQEPY